MSLNFPTVTYCTEFPESYTLSELGAMENISNIFPIHPYIIFTFKKNNTAGVLHISGQVNSLLYSEDYSVSETRPLKNIEVSTLDDEYILKIDITSETFTTHFKADFTVTVSLNGIEADGYATIADITESSASTRFNAVLEFPKDGTVGFLKAFCNFPREDSFPNLACLIWEYSFDGIHWEELALYDREIFPLTVAVSVPVIDVLGNTLESSDSPNYVKRNAYALFCSGVEDFYSTRPDCVALSGDAFKTQPDNLCNIIYRCRMLTLREVNYDVDDVPKDLGVEFIEDLYLGNVVYTPIFSTKIEPLHSTICNASESLSLYYNHRLYGFGNSKFKNTIVATYAGETVRPISESIELNTSDVSTVTALVPWKDYVIAFTETSAHVITRDADGFKTTAINSYIGVPIEDCRCVKNILNGVIFKSGSKLYLIYPNIYSGTETVLNLTDVSSPIEDYLIEYDETSENLPFALSTETAYMLFMPKETCTVCLKYEYNVKRWTLFEYPVIITAYEMLSVTDIRVTGYITDSNGKRRYAEYFIEQDLSDCYENVPENVFSGDWISESSKGIQTDLQEYEQCLNEGILRPISFSIDSGQKTDSPVTEKMFTESKFIVSTLHEKDTFPMRVTVHVNGDPKVHTTNVYTDSAFWQNPTGVGTLSTNFSHDNSDTFNVIRQMFIRYSGKGKSIRHIIEGESVYPFKIYEMLYRYRSLNTKQ